MFRIENIWSRLKNHQTHITKTFFVENVIIINNKYRARFLIRLNIFETKHVEIMFKPSHRGNTSDKRGLSIRVFRESRAREAVIGQHARSLYEAPPRNRNGGTKVHVGATVISITCFRFTCVSFTVVPTPVNDAATAAAAPAGVVSQGGL